VIGWAINVAYLLALLLFSPLLIYRRLRQGKYRAGWNEKLWGRLPRTEGNESLIWVHAVSVGEVLLIEPLVHALRAASPETRILITTTTSTGWDVACRRYPQCQVCYFPWDFTWSVRNALRRVQPHLIVLVELELWPNLLRLAQRKQIPVVLVNGRLSERSYRGYRWLKPLLAPALRSLRMVCVQNDEYRDRFVALGADVSKVVVTGSLKFDGVRCDREASAMKDMASQMPMETGELLWLAGSTHAPEEEIVLGIYSRLVPKHPTWRLMLVPRHAERFDEVSRLVRERGFAVWERATGNELPGASTSPIAKQRPVLLLNTLGELSTAWSLADLAFVGGSLTSRGGQNMIEPAAYGVPTIVGPHTANFRQIVEALVKAESLQVATDASQLESFVDALMADAEQRRRLGARSREFVRTQQGTTQRTLESIRPWLPVASKE
jgi:3-deoxy-D-manno-octulosonic-acid transferase